MKSFPHSLLRPDHERRLTGAASATTPSRAESLLAAEKRTLEMMANGASLSEVLNVLSAAIDAHAGPDPSRVCLKKGEGHGQCGGRNLPATFKAAITPWRIGPER